MSRAFTRAARRKSAAHDQGNDRHHKGASWIKKQQRLAAERRVRKAKQAPQ